MPEELPLPPPVEVPPAVRHAPDGRVDVEALLDELTPRQKLAQLVIPWVAGAYQAFDDSALARAAGWVDSLQVGGIIVSVGSPLDIAAKLNYLQRRSALPLLIASDLEAGTAGRFVGGTPFPTNMGVGATGRELDAYEMGRITALEGRAVGIGLAFAPVADVNNNPANPIINTRSFGEDPAAVARYVTAAVRGMQEHGLPATVKHFPGHGDTGTDSHIALPVITADWRRLDTLELVPFRAAVDAGVTAVMSAHIALPGIDSGRTRPATVTPEVLTGILRDSLGFRGLIVTDALDMGALVSAYGAGQAAVLAFRAGADLLLQPADPAVALDSLVAAYGRHEITDERLDESVRRVLRLKRQLGLFRRRTVNLEAIPEVVGDSAFRAEAQAIAARSLVLAKDSAGTVAALRRGRDRVTLVTYGDENSPNVGVRLSQELRTAGHPVTVFKLWPMSGAASYDSARAILGRNGTAVFVASVRTSAWRGTLALPDAMAGLIDSVSRTRPTVLVSEGSPYIIQQAPSAGSYLLGWTPNALAETAIGQALGGRAPITGHLPISIPPYFTIGTGIERR
ncbi:MAG TPA: glycoside hydrolase family 3 N-terminal domain-containing protein [Gemmatimonadales bacterium]|nr:glycoside hydrolase family 3 N-terminal domain-containing protein [Gemmatimonadales bacterium]